MIRVFYPQKTVFLDINVTVIFFKRLERDWIPDLITKLIRKMIYAIKG